MTANGPPEDAGEWALITKQLAGSTECAAASKALFPEYGDGGEGAKIILHCNRGYGHDGDHEFTIQWPRNPDEKDGQ